MKFRLMLLNEQTHKATELTIEPKDMSMLSIDGGQVSYSMTADLRRRITELIAAQLDGRELDPKLRKQIEIPSAVKVHETGLQAGKLVPFKQRKEF